MANHLVLTVHDLPTDGNPGGIWYVNAGLGDALYEPIPLIAGRYRQGPFELGIERTPGGVGDWHLTHDPKGGFAGMSWRSEPAAVDSFSERHGWLSTSPESGFVRVPTVQRRDATGADILRGLVLRRVGERPSETTIESRGRLFEVLEDAFGLRISADAAPARSKLWERVSAAHATWEAAGRP